MTFSRFMGCRILSWLFPFADLVVICIMLNNYYFLRKLSDRLAQKLQGYMLMTAFSQNKDELILGFASHRKEFWIRANLQANLNFLTFPESFSRAKTNSIDLFKPTMKLEVTGTYQHLNERAFQIQLQNGFSLLFKMFGNRSNVILLKEGKAAELFLHKFPDDWELEADQLDRPIQQDFKHFQTHGLKGTFPTFGKELKELLHEQGFATADGKEQWRQLEDLLEMLENPSFNVCQTINGPEFLLFEKGEVLFSSYDPIAASNDFFYKFSRTYFLEKEKQAAIKLLTKHLNRTQNYIEKNESKLHELEHEARHEEIANIIMANLHAIPPRSKKAELYDFYRDQTISIKLNEKLTPQKNAENYYRKAKNQKIEVGKLRQNTLEKRKDYEAYEWHLERIKEMDQVKELRKYLKENRLQHVSDQEVAFPFRRFFFQGFEILVGKNSQNNDLLTQKYAYKEDLWLHARDVGGSHVVLKYQAGKQFPTEVLEKAASLAAWYSQRKTDTLCPVICTPKKYVRKVKGAAAGEVVVDKEEVIMIEPAPFGS